jgi:hypothetical protein
VEDISFTVQPDCKETVVTTMNTSGHNLDLVWAGGIAALLFSGHFILVNLKLSQERSFTESVDVGSRKDWETRFF